MVFWYRGAKGLRHFPRPVKMSHLSRSLYRLPIPLPPFCKPLTSSCILLCITWNSRYLMMFNKLLNSVTYNGSRLLLVMWVNWAVPRLVSLGLTHWYISLSAAGQEGPRRPHLQVWQVVLVLVREPLFTALILQSANRLLSATVLAQSSSCVISGSCDASQDISSRTQHSVTSTTCYWSKQHKPNPDSRLREIVSSWWDKQQSHIAEKSRQRACAHVWNQYATLGT